MHSTRQSLTAPGFLGELGRFRARQRLVNVSDAFNPLNLPGLKFWFNADTVSGSSATVWNDMTGGFKATALGLIPRPFNTTFSTKKGAVFQNDNGSMQVTKLNGSQVYTPGSLWPSSGWAALLASVDGASGPLLNRPLLTTRYTFSNFDQFMELGSIGSSIAGWSMRTMCGNGAAWGDQQANVPFFGSPVVPQPNSQLVVFILQSNLGGSGGYARVNGVEYNFQPPPFGAKTFNVGGSAVTSGYFTIGAAGVTNNTTTRANIRQVLYGEGQLSAANLEKLEEFLYEDGGLIIP